jgi:uridine phosphorylase
MPARLRPTAPIAADAILVGDPGRALLLAQALLEQPKMSNHARGLWGYSGRTPAGHELTIQSTGMGGPSAAVVLADLAELRVRRAIRVGTCSAVESSFAPGELIVVTAARSHPFRGSFVAGSTTKEPRKDELQPDADLARRLREKLGQKARPGSVVSLDHLPGLGSPPLPADVADMQTAALFARGAELGVAMAAVLIVSETVGTGLPDEDMEEAARRAGEAAAAALSP